MVQRGAEKNVPVMSILGSVVRRESRAGIQARSSILEVAVNRKMQIQGIPMKFLSLYKSQERGVPPTQEEMNKMGKLIEEGMKAGWLVATEGCLPSASARAFVGLTGS